ncbi:MAG: HD domain-containing protein [Acholeplasmataceae bacterium]|nr:HD domain-containing protein [Acholeplasmataceae bacterium]
MDKNLLDYLHHQIIPQYQSLDQAHQMDHVEKVIHDALKIARDYPVNLDMVYVIACFHDLGLLTDRRSHHIIGGNMLLEDQVIRAYFSKDEINLMKEAIEDHRASNENPPRSIYGKIIAEADRNLDPMTIFKRTLQFGLKHSSTYDKDQQIERAIDHIKDKYGPKGYLKLWLNTEQNQIGLKKIHMLLEDEPQLTNILKQIYDEIEK